MLFKNTIVRCASAPRTLQAEEDPGQRAVAMPLLTRFRHTRATTVGLCERLEAEDFVVQSMPDASPAKWHLAHTAWFFEEFLLGHFRSDYQCFEPRYGLLFNSYYKGVGQAFTRAERGLLSRPTVRDVMDYRQHVDSAMEELLARRGDDAEMQRLAELGCHHEQQHQELLLTDIKHAFSLNPLRPAYQDKRPPSLATAAMPLRFAEFAGGVVPVGHAGSEFSFDNETPRHQVLLQPFALGKRLVTNAEYRDFVTAGGYRDPAHWLADGWAVVEQEQWQRPIYWDEACASEFTLMGQRAIDPNGPVCHLSFYEADAFARASSCRLPTEFEWELAAPKSVDRGNFLDSDNWHPVPSAAAGDSLSQMFGDVWEWTQSPYSPYPRFKSWSGRIAEYNGKFMANQFVLRGGSCVTPRNHIRATYRNFFPPNARWQFAGLRLAKDC